MTKSSQKYNLAIRQFARQIKIVQLKLYSRMLELEVIPEHGLSSEQIEFLLGKNVLFKVT